MSLNNLKYNIQKELKKRNYSIAEFEKQAGLKKNNVYNILKGIVQTPSSANVQAIANALKINIQDLFADPSNIIFTENLSTENKQLISDITQKIIDLSEEDNIPISLEDFYNLQKKIFEYNKSMGLKKLDVNFLKWTLKENYGK